MNRRILTCVAAACFLLSGDLLACGDKFLIAGRGTRYQRPKSARAASVLIYANPSTTLPAALSNMKVDSVLKGEANLLLFPNLDSANLSMTLLKEMNNALAVGPILMGPRAPAHILAPSTTSRGIVNMTAIAASEAVALGEKAG